VGLDPTNNLIASDRRIRVAIGRDDADVPHERSDIVSGRETVVS
jgi:transglutaminase-like putative cysteine protease